MNSQILENKKLLSKYQKNALKQLKRTSETREKRRQKALLLASQAATLLQQKFGVSKVVLFGSILEPNCFTQWSDIDLAVWGLKSEDTLLAMEIVDNLNEDIEINLVDVNTAKSEILKNIRQKHQEI